LNLNWVLRVPLTFIPSLLTIHFFILLDNYFTLSCSLNISTFFPTSIHREIWYCKRISTPSHDIYFQSLPVYDSNTLPSRWVSTSLCELPGIIFFYLLKVIPPAILPSLWSLGFFLDILGRIGHSTSAFKHVAIYLILKAKNKKQTAKSSSFWGSTFCTI
jgi:hypothetical protein